MATENRAGVLRAAGRAGRDTDVMLVPLPGREGPAGPPVPIFAGFVASMLSGDFVKQVCCC